MPLGIMNDEDFNSELGKSTEIEVARIEDRKVGRGSDNNAVPDSLRKVIGEESVVNGRQSAIELASKFGIDKVSVSAYKNGSTSVSTYDKQPNLAFLNSARFKISRKASEVLGQALEEITAENKLSACSAIELASVAKSMSGIVKDMEPETARNPEDGNSGPTYVFYAPILKNEQHYDVVNARD